MWPRVRFEIEDPERPPAARRPGALLLAAWGALLLLAAGCGEPPAGVSGRESSAADRPPEGETAIAREARPDRPSLVLIVVDTVRADHLGLYGHERPTSPQLDAWAQRGAVFDRAIASSSWTLPSFASIYTGLHPGRHGAGEDLGDGRLDGRELEITGIRDEVPTLAELLSKAGYATGAFVNNPFLHSRFGVARGFDDYSFAAASNSAIRDAHTTVDAALAWIDARESRPVFAMIHLMDPHMDYDPPPDIAGRFTAGYRGRLRHPVTNGARMRLGLVPLDDHDREFVAGGYDEELLNTDRELGRLLDALDERGAMREGYVVVTSDHGEELFEHGSFEHGHAAYQELLHVPLVVWGPDVRAGRIAEPVSHVDLFPTLLDLAGLDVPGDLPGVSLVPALESRSPIADRPLLADRTLHGRRHRVLIRWPWKAIDVEGRSPELLFHLERDPLEQSDLAEQEPERLAAMLAEFEALSPTREREAHERKAAALDDTIRAQLEALGYATPSGEPHASEGEPPRRERGSLE